MSNKKSEQNRTRLKKEAFLELFPKEMGNVSKICEKVGIGRTTYYEWLKKDQAFAEEIENCEEGLIDYVESKMYKLIKEDNPTMIIFYLKTQGKKRGYIESAEHIHSGGVILECSDEFLPDKPEEPK